MRLFVLALLVLELLLELWGLGGVSEVYIEMGVEELGWWTVRVGIMGVTVVGVWGGRVK